MNEVQSTISREMGAASMSTMDILLHAVTHVLQYRQNSRQAATQNETDESIEVIELATTVNTGTAGRIREEFEYVTERGEIMVITATTIMNWTNEARTHRQRAAIEEDEKRWAWHFENYSK